MKPLMIFGMIYLVFAVFLLRGKTNPLENFPVQLLIGIVVYSFFAEATGTSLSSVVANSDMVKKAYFPRWILVLAATLSAAMTLAVNFVLMLSIGIPLHWYHVSLQTVILPLLFMEVLLLALGAGLLLSALYVYFRDLGHIWEVVLQFLFFTSMVIFPFSLIPPNYQVIVMLNPLAQVIEDLRRALVSPIIPWSADVVGARILIPILLVIAALGVGVLAFNRLSRRFGERL
jgi:ABC-2 type transport system permease protein